MIGDFCLAHELGAVSLRYFNVAGVSGDLGEDHDPETHLIPNILRTAPGPRERQRLLGAGGDRGRGRGHGSRDRDPRSAAPAGDPPMLVGASELIRPELGWEARKPARSEMVADAWAVAQARTRGYSD